MLLVNLCDVIPTPMRKHLWRTPKRPVAPSHDSKELQGADRIQTPNFPIKNVDWLVVSTHLKNTSQNGNLPQIGVKIKNVWNHHLVDKIEWNPTNKKKWRHPCSLESRKYPNFFPSNKSPFNSKTSILITVATGRIPGELQAWRIGE